VADDVIKSFLARLGFQVDEASLKKFNESLESTTKRAMALGATMQAAALLVAAGVDRFATKLESLYYASERTKQSASNLLGFKYAVQQVGGTAEQAGAMVDKFNDFLRSTPGSDSFIRGFGIEVRDAAGNMRDINEIFDDISKRIKASPNQPFEKGLVESWGLDYDIMRRGHFKENSDKQKAMQRASGIDPDALKEGAKDFKNTVRDIEASFELLGYGVAANLQKVFGPQMERFQKWLMQPDTAKHVTEGLTALVNVVVWFTDKAIALFNWIVRLDQATDGLSTRIIAVLAALKFLGLGPITLLTGAFKGLLALFTGGGMATLATLQTWLVGITAAGAGGYAVGTGILWLLDEVAKKATGLEGATFGTWMGDIVNGSKDSDLTRVGPGYTSDRKRLEAQRGEGLMGKAARLVEFFEGTGHWTHKEAVGIVAGIGAESKFDPTAVNPKSGAWGLGQLLGDRKKEFFAKYGKNNVNWMDQARWLDEEMTTGKERAAAAAIHGARGNSADVATAYLTKNMRPGKDELPADVARAQGYIGKIENTFNINGAKDPQATADAVASKQNQVNDNLTRNMLNRAVGS